MNLNFWKITPIRQRHYTRRRSFSGSGWKISLTAGNLPEGSDQFNSLQEKLIDRFVELREQYGFQLLHLTCCRDTVEDRGTIQYLQDCATEAEIATEFLYIDDIGLGEKGQFTDLQDQVISNLFKLYPWEFMLREMFSTKLEDAGVRWLEPSVEEHYLQQGTSTAVVGDVPESPEPAARLFCGR